MVVLRTRCIVAAAWAAGLLCILSASVSAEDPMAGPYAFDDGIQAARAQLADGDCKKGVAALQALLEQHAKKNYAKARRLEIEELMRSLACGTKFKRPKPKDLVSGQLRSWSAKTGKIKIKYTPKASKDLEKRDGFLYFPARLNGPFTLEIKGKSYPTGKAETPEIHVGGVQHPDTGKVQLWKIRFGSPKKGKGRSPPKVTVEILHGDGGDESTVSTKTTTAGKKGKAWKVLVKAVKKKITASLNGRSLGSAKNPESLYGYLGFRAGGWTEAKLSASIEPTWIQGQVDEVLWTQLDEFDKTYDPSEYLPVWLSHALTKDRSRKRDGVDLLGALDDKFYDSMQEVYNHLREDEFDAAVGIIAQMQAGGAPEATCEYLRAETYRRATQLEQAIVHAKLCMELEPAFLEVGLMQGNMLRELGRFDEALKAFEKAMAGHSQYPHAFEEAASAMLMAGRPEDAKRITQMAARNGVNSEKLISLNGALAKVVHGPRWRKRFEHKSQNYHVTSDMDQSICREAATLLEEAFAAFREKLGFVPRDRTRLFRVFLFGTKDGFMAYQGDLEEFMGKPSEKAAGLYSPLLKQLLIWNLPRRADMMETIRHEGFHQYLDRLLPSRPPVWFNEGLAVYHENARKEGGKLTFGHVQGQYVGYLLVKGMRPLDKFIFGGPRKFYEDGHRSYGQAWALVHMLRHTTPENLAIFDQLVKGLKTDNSYNVLKKLFPPSVITRLEKELRKYVQDLPSD